MQSVNINTLYPCFKCHAVFDSRPSLFLHCCFDVKQPFDVENGNEIGEENEIIIFLELQKLLTSHEGYIIERVHHIPWSCDILIKRNMFPDIRVECKANGKYNRFKLCSSEVDKFVRDLKHNKSHGILVSTFSDITGIQQFEFKRILENGLIARFLESNQFKIGDIVRSVQAIYAEHQIILHESTSPICIYPAAYLANVSNVSNVSYECPGCAYTSTVKVNMMRHCTKKFSCSDNFEIEIAEYLATLQRKISEFSCKWCNKTFAHKNYMYVHQKICKCKVTVAVAATGPSQESTSIGNTATVVDVSINNIDRSVNTKIVNGERKAVRSFGNESLEHISAEMMESYIASSDIVQFIRDLQFNSGVPENHNIKRIKKIKKFKNTEMLATFDETGVWKQKTRDEILTDAKRNACRHLKAFIHKNNVDITSLNAFGKNKISVINDIILDKTVNPLIFPLLFLEMFYVKI